MEKVSHIYDVLILGGGPAGYTAALYTARAGLDTLVLEKLCAGGQMALTHQIDNYPGFADGIDGFELGMRMQAGAERFGAKTEIAEVQAADLTGQIKTVRTSEGEFRGRTVVIATGAGPRELGVAREQELLGKGIHYCAACDGMFYKGKTVAVVGGGNSAAADALQLARLAKKVIIVHRRDTLKATKIYHKPLMEAPNVDFCWNCVVEALLGEERVRGIRVKDVSTGQTRELECDGVFVSIGREPVTALFKGQMELDPAGYLVAEESARTGIPGVFAAGDVRAKELRQVVTAAADGAAAAHCIEQYLAEQ